MLNRKDIVVLDTETTGLDSDARVCEIAIIDGFGNVLLNTLVNPNIGIPAQATEIHGITNEMVQNSPSLDDLLNDIRQALNSRTLCIYNKDYDIRVLYQSMPTDNNKLISWDSSSKQFCVMLDYAEFYGELNHYGDYKWQRLTNACHQQGVDVSAFKAHRALADCQMTLALMNQYLVIEG